MTQTERRAGTGATPAKAPQVVAPPAPARGTSTFVTGDFPRRRWLVIAVGSLIGFLLTVVWSAPFVDAVIGDSIADTMLGTSAKETEISGIVAGVIFAFVSGVAGTFTACNIAVFGAVAPLLGRTESKWERVRRTLAPLGWLAAGMVAISVTYGAIVGLVGTRMPQFSTEIGPPGTIPPRLVQSVVVFGIIGLVMIYLGLAALGVVRDPMAKISVRFPQAPMVLMGLLIGGFLIGRPFPLFRQLFRDAAESGNPLYGAAAFTLQSIGNIVIMAVLFLLLTVFAGRRLQAWFAAKPGRMAGITAGALLVAGVFTFLYWDVRLLAVRDIIPWYPVAPWV